MSSSDAPADPASFLDRTAERTRERFVREKTLLSFAEYLDVVAQRPAEQSRDAAMYLRDVFLHFGTETVQRPYGRFTRYRLFDCPFDDGRDRLIGHEAVQEAVFGLLTDFVKDGRVSKLILLHGPNGSAKSSFISCIMRAMEAYSAQPEGAQYTFNWVFPAGKLQSGNIGFGGQRALRSLDSYAHLPESDVDARIRTETRDHPLLLLPRADRIAFLRAHLGPDAALPRILSQGELSPKSRVVFDALLKAYQGDLAEVLKHVQVERFYISRRYRQAAVTVDPQLRVDAGVRQVTADRSLASLPPSLQNLTLYEPMGDLVDANRGLLEYNDLLKRPIEAFKYLLSTCENGTVRLDTMTLYLDSVFIGSCNAGHLTAFKEAPDFASFKARIELVQVPYLVDAAQEQRIYADLIAGPAIDKPVAPHTAQVAGLWAVITRLERPNPEVFDPALAETLGRLSPLEKARLFAEGVVPDGLPRDVANTLVSTAAALYQERRDHEHYEGRFGASPREIRAAVLAAARTPDARCLTPMAVIDALRDLCRQTSVYQFLRLKPDADYHQPLAALDVVQTWYMDLVEEELHQAMGLVDRVATADLFSRYVDHVMHYVRKEKQRNPVTGRSEDPDERLMRDVEGRLNVRDAERDDYRAGVMHRIAAWRMDNPDAELSLPTIFQDRISRLNDAFYDEKRKQSERIERDLLTLLVHGEERLEPDAKGRAEATLANLERDFGYSRLCAVEVVGHLLKARSAKS